MNSPSADTFKGTILVVDDSPDNLRVLSASLSNLGYKVRCVTNGEMALVSVKSCPPDLILLDIRMPMLDGYAVCQRLKANSETEEIPIIFLSALDDVFDKVKAFDMGGADYITKPFQTPEIVARIVHQLTIQRLKNQLTQQNQQLHQEIEAHKRTTAALQDAKEIAEIANWAKSNFMARMSHELRTPLNSILGFSGLMLNDSSLTADHQDYVAGIHKSARHLLKMINQVLTVTRDESAQITLSRRSFDLHCLLAELVSDWRSHIEQRGLEFNLVVGPQVPQWIYSDDGKLRQILIQLLKNALQFTPAGQITLYVSLEDSSGPGAASQTQPNPVAQPAIPVLFFSVEDTGCGISDSEGSQLFQAFTQCVWEQHPKQGLGLGLYLSHQYIQALGGQINLASTPGQGTCVSFFVPVQAAIAPEETLVIAPGSAPPLDPLPGSAMPPETVAALIAEVLEQRLPQDWVMGLNRAAMQGFDQQVAALIQQIPEEYGSLATVLSDWNRQFQFDLILAVTQPLIDWQR